LVPKYSIYIETTKMIKTLKYFFYKIYSFSLSNGESDAGWAYAIVSVFLIANIYSLLDLVMIITESKIPEVSNIFIIAMCGLVLFLNHILLLKDGMAKEITKEFKEMRGSKAILNLFLFLYITVSIVLFIYTGNVVRSMNQ
jgi:hypothetical protein